MSRRLVEQVVDAAVAVCGVSLCELGNGRVRHARVMACRRVVAMLAPEIVLAATDGVVAEVCGWRDMEESVRVWRREGDRCLAQNEVAFDGDEAGTIWWRELPGLVTVELSDIQLELSGEKTRRISQVSLKGSRREVLAAMELGTWTARKKLLDACSLCVRTFDESTRELVKLGYAERRQLPPSGGAGRPEVAYRRTIRAELEVADLACTEAV